MLLTVPLVAELASGLAQQAGLTKHDLAYYLDDATLNFVRPGLTVKILSSTIQNNQISVRFLLTDPKGLPLDRAGVQTPGAVSTSFVAAYIASDDDQYTSYVTRIETDAFGSGLTATQATADSGGTYTTNATGDYTYTFKTPIPATYDPTVTHTVGIWASRDLSDFSLGTSYADATFDFVPNGSPVTKVRADVSTAACNQCHNPLSAHGGARRSVQLCVLCHTPQSSDAETGNTVDFEVMIHRIHMGANLPSVTGKPLNVLNTNGSPTGSGGTENPVAAGTDPAGKPYQIVGYQNAVNDYSAVVFPSDVRRCETCHQGASMASNYFEMPSRKACGACHDDVNFATGLNHVNLPQVDDNLCATCHVPQGELEFDASIKGGHTIPSFSKQLAGVKFSILNVQNTAAGQNPTVTFSVKDNTGTPWDVSKMDFLNMVLAGPTTDYPSSVSEDVRGATAAGNSFIYTFKAAIPSGATGTYAVGIEGFKSETINPGTVLAKTVRDVGFNQVSYFSVDGSKVVPRRKVVDLNTCNTCHGTLAAHGGIRRNTEYCLLCHNPNATDADRRPAAQAPAQSIHFKTMIHRIHTDTDDVTNDLTIFGFNGAPIDYNAVHFPGDRSDCVKCHVNNSQQLPLPDGLLPTVSPRDYIPVMQPIQAACLACHATKPAAAHAAVMTSPTLGESCEACHGTNADFSIDKMHAR